MAKFKLPKYKFLFAKKKMIGTDDHEPAEVDYHFGNKETEKLNFYEYHKYHMGWFFSDVIDYSDNRKYEHQSKFTSSEANILLLKYIELKLKEARKNYKETVKLIEKNVEDNLKHYYHYTLKVRKRELDFYTNAAKKHRKIVRELKKTPEYMWEQMLKWKLSVIT